jgi:3-isopropylmalate/(R)-2-methylmalate dehydratase large subunit
MPGQTLLDKIWRRHVIATDDAGRDLLFIDRHFVHDGCSQAFELLELEARDVHRPDLTFGTPDHYVPTTGGVDGFANETRRNMVVMLEKNAARWKFEHFGFQSNRQGIVHVIGPELGITLPGLVLVCGDSHTSTHGALGAFAFGIGATEMAHVLATQTLWQARPKAMRITVDGSLGAGVTAKDVILHIIGEIGTDGATGHVIEYAGSAISDLSIEGRLTLCNMSIEAGGRAGFIAPDDKTISYIEGKPFAPKGANWDMAVAFWRNCVSDAAATFDREVAIDAAAIAPTVTWGTSPEDAIPVTANVPDPAQETDVGKRRRQAKALDYMGLTPGTPLQHITIDRVFIGSCTNGRIEDLRAAAQILKGRQVTVPTMAVPGSATVKAEAEREGLDRVFTEAGVEWRDPGCSMCVGMNGVDLVAAGDRCASTSNRNFAGRQGRGACTHLMSPAMAAAAAVEGRITDARVLAPKG